MQTLMNRMSSPGSPSPQAKQPPASPRPTKAPRFGLAPVSVATPAPLPSWATPTNQPLPPDIFQPQPYPATGNQDALSGPESTSKPHYSDIQPLLSKKQVQEVTILVDPKSFTRLPIANVSLTNGTNAKLVLPRDMKAFTATLDQAHVPYTYKSTAHDGAGGKILDWAGGVATEMVGPFALLGATTMLGMWGMKRFNQYQEESELKASIGRARKDMSKYPYQFKDVVDFHSAPVQARMNDFLLGITNALIVKGYPGLGKTHILNAMAREVSQNKPNTMILNVSTSVGENVRKLLQEIYGGDKVLAPKAMKVLQQQNGGRPVKEILMYADELERSPDLQGMQDLLTKGIGNPASNLGFELPKLRLLATCNDYPGILSDEAVSSRVGKMLVPPPQAKESAKILAESLHNSKGKMNLPQKEALAEAFEKVLGENPGYSPRTLSDSVKPSLIHKAGQAKDKPDAAGMAKLLQQDLSSRNLNHTELAGLIGHNIIRDAMSGRQALHPEKGPVGLWENLHDSAKSATSDAKEQLALDGKTAQRQIEKALKRHSYDLSDPGSVDQLSGEIVKDLKKNRLEALYMPDKELPEQKQSELKLIRQMGDVITNILKADSLETKTGKVQSHSNQQERDALSQLKKNLFKLDSKSPAGKDLAEAARLHQEMVKEFTDPEHHTFPTPERIRSVLIRAINYDPAKHLEEADYGVIPDEKYVELFKRMNRMARHASGQAIHVR